MNRVYMIPEKDFHRQQRQLSLPSTTNNPVNAIQKSLQDLNALELSDAARWKEYEQLFNTYNAYSKKHTAPTAIYHPEGENEDEVKDFRVSSLFSSEDQKEDVVMKVIVPILHTLPQKLKEKGKQLIEFIAQTQDVQNGDYQISHTGELRIQGKGVVGSNILDLIHFAVRPKRKTVSTPNGWFLFLNFLRKNNVPSELLAPHHRHQRYKWNGQRMKIPKRQKPLMTTMDEEDGESEKVPTFQPAIIKAATLDFNPSYTPHSPPKLRSHYERRRVVPYEASSKKLSKKQVGKGVWSVYH